MLQRGRSTESRGLREEWRTRVHCTPDNFTLFRETQTNASNSPANSDLRSQRRWAHRRGICRDARTDRARVHVRDQDVGIERKNHVHQYRRISRKLIRPGAPTAVFDAGHFRTGALRPAAFWARHPARLESARDLPQSRPLTRGQCDWPRQVNRTAIGRERGGQSASRTPPVS